MQYHHMRGMMQSSLLFRMPSFSKGMARTVSIFGGLDKYRTYKPGSEADAKALARDWQIVGQTMMQAINTYAKSHNK